MPAQRVVRILAPDPRGNGEGDDSEDDGLLRTRERRLKRQPSSRRRQRRRHHHRLWCAGWCSRWIFHFSAASSLLTLLFFIKISMFDSFTKPVDSVKPPGEATDSQQHGDFRRPSSDYVLDPAWDFEALPTVREYSWLVKDVEANPDGVFRPMIMINGKFPGELIRCNEGDTIVVNVENRSVNTTSFHWHGLFQNGTNWMDGTPGVTQCGIAPGRRFRYEFTVKGQAGTCAAVLLHAETSPDFYHGHQAGQALDGLVGPLIIHSRDEKSQQQQQQQQQTIPYATDRVVMIQDYYHDLSSGLLKEKLSPGNEAPPTPNGALINGANVVDCSLYPHRRCDNSTAQLPLFDFAPPHANHRLRFVNVGALTWFEVSVDSHGALPVTEVDGVDVEPVPEKTVVIAPGQRYSVVLLAANRTDTADDNDNDNDNAFWMRARMLTHCYNENALPQQGMAEAKAVIRYASPATAAGGGGGGGAAVMPTTENDSGVFTTFCKDMTAQQPYAPTPPRPAPEHADYSYHLRINVEIGNWRLERGFVNRSSYRAQLASPVLHRVLDGLTAGNASFDSSHGGDGDGGGGSSGSGDGVNDRAFDARSELVISHDAVRVVDLVLQNFDEGNHPFHLHGHQMFVLAAGHGYFPGYAALGLAPEGRGLLDPTNTSVVANPVRRDVATIEGFGWSLVRFVADNPGAWLFHCHIMFHGESGMAMLFLSRLDLLRNWTLPSENRALCDASVEELELGAPPKDSTWFGHPG